MALSLSLSTAVLVTRQAVKLRRVNSPACLLKNYVCLQSWTDNVIKFNSIYRFSRTIFTTPCMICKTKSQQPAEEVDFSLPDINFRNIYTFRYIVHARVLSRLKIYQTLVTVGAVIPGVFFYSSGVISGTGLAAFFGVASMAGSMLYIMSGFFRHIVGIISVNQTEDIVRISHLTFWGKRVDEHFELSEIVPFSDLSLKANDIYQVIQFYEQPSRFYWFMRHGKNVDAEAVGRLFGKL